jgi:Na+-translocating ferredoxin:NAD+ oxidoreductase subunit B
MSRSSDPTRRGFVADGIRVLGAIGLGGAVCLLSLRKGRPCQSSDGEPNDGETLANADSYVWQIDPDKCIACDQCQLRCVLDESAVKAVQCFALCGFCDICTGYFPTNDKNYKLETGAENQLCPTGAIVRKYIPEKGDVRFFEYTVQEPLCIGCGKCVAGCRLMNGSLSMQIRHDRCVNCNECAIAVACPTQAIRRVPAAAANLLGKAAREAEAAQARKRAPEKLERASDA